MSQRNAIMVRIAELEDAVQELCAQLEQSRVAYRQRVIMYDIAVGTNIALYDENRKLKAELAGGRS